MLCRIRWLSKVLWANVRLFQRFKKPIERERGIYVYIYSACLPVSVNPYIAERCTRTEASIKLQKLTIFQSGIKHIQCIYNIYIFIHIYIYIYSLNVSLFFRRCHNFQVNPYVASFCLVQCHFRWLNLTIIVYYFSSYRRLRKPWIGFIYIYIFVNIPLLMQSFKHQIPIPVFFSDAAAPAGSMLRSLWHHALPRLRPATTQTDTIRSGQGWGGQWWLDGIVQCAPQVQIRAKWL